MHSADLHCIRTDTSADSKWCSRHEELQAKSLKSYKRVSFELEAFQSADIDSRGIDNCQSQEQLQLWAASLRKKWILTKRTIESRSKHHLQFYAGGDASHQAFISNLTAARVALEDLLLSIDDRAYSLLVLREKAEWLDVPAPIGPDCNDDPVVSRPQLELSDGPPSPLSDEDTLSNATSDREDEPVFSDVSTEAETDSSASCTSDCCQPSGDPSSRMLPIRRPTYRDQVLAYLGYASYFCDCEADFHVASRTMDNIFRYVISRIPRLLVRARAAGCTTVQCFLASDALSEEEHARLWRALKYNNVNQEGKINVDVIRNAICDAENEDILDNRGREGACIELLGGKVWKTPLGVELTLRGWNHFYRFTSCSGCALSVTRSFEAWSRNRQLSRPGMLYSGWSETGESAAEATLGACGAIICGSHRKGKTGSLEHIKPKKRGMKSVWIERDSRNWVFLRFDEKNPLAQTLHDSVLSDMAVYSWSACGERSAVKESASSCGASSSTTWVTRLRSGYTPAERKAARWTPDGSFKHTECTHERLLSGSPEAYFRKGQPFKSGSVDILVVDCGIEQNFDGFLQRIANAMGVERISSVGGAEPVQDVSGLIGGRSSLNDKALYAARQFFREVPSGRTCE